MRKMIGVSEIGQKSEQILGWGIFGIVVITEDFHWEGTIPLKRDILNKKVIGFAIQGAASLRNQDGSPSGPLDVDFKLSKLENTVISSKIQCALLHKTVDLQLDTV